MTAIQTSDALAFLAQGMSLKDVASTLGVSEWQIAAIIGRGR